MRRLYLRSPTCVLNVVMQLLSGASSSWWYPDERSNLLKTVALLRSATRSSIVGIRCLTALLASRMSTHILTWPDLLGTMTIRLTQGVGPVTVSMMSSSSNRFNSISTSFLTWKEIRRCGCCLDMTSESMWSLMTFPFTLLIPPKSWLSKSLSNGWLGTGLVRFDLVDDPEHAKFCSIVKTQEISWSAFAGMQGRPCAVGVNEYFGLNSSQNR